MDSIQLIDEGQIRRDNLLFTVADAAYKTAENSPQLSRGRDPIRAAYRETD